VKIKTLYTYCEQVGRREKDYEKTTKENEATLASLKVPNTAIWTSVIYCELVVFAFEFPCCSFMTYTVYSTSNIIRMVKLRKMR
jgi:hypothetical protein